MKNVLIGTIYYNKKKELFKVVNFKKNEKYILQDENGELKTVTKKQLMQGYTRLKPAGYIVFSVVEFNDDKDVIVALYREKQSQKEAQYELPYCVCRQNVINIFSKQLDNIDRVGMSVSLDTSDIDTVLAMTNCSKIDTAIAVSVYLNNTLQDILALFDNHYFDVALKSMRFNKLGFIPGYCNLLEELLIQEDFMYDFCTAFGIEKVDFPINIINKETGYVDPIQTVLLEKTFSVEVFDAFAFEFDYTIRLKDIQKQYKLVFSVPDNKLYVIAFTEGKYYNDYARAEIKNMRNTIFENSKLLSD